MPCNFNRRFAFDSTRVMANNKCSVDTYSSPIESASSSARSMVCVSSCPGCGVDPLLDFGKRFISADIISTNCSSLTSSCSRIGRTIPSASSTKRPSTCKQSTSALPCLLASVCDSNKASCALRVSFSIENAIAASLFPQRAMNAHTESMKTGLTATIR